MLEAELEAFLLRIVPDLESDWAPAPPNELEALEERIDITGHEMPAFHRWFLEHMGGSVGALAPALGGFTTRNVLTAYASGSVWLEKEEYLLGRFDDPVMPLDVFYDLTHPVEGDARVVRQVAEAGNPKPIAESFREHVAAAAFKLCVLSKAPQRCFGAFTSDFGDVAPSLDDAMASAGFSCPLTTGTFCRLYERDDGVAMLAQSTLEAEGILVFRIGGADTTAIRRLLGHVATQTDLDVDASRWSPPA